MILWQSLWRDEAFSALLALRSPGEIIGLSSGDSTPPLFYLLLHFWTLLFGNSEVALRSLTLLFFLATALVLYKIGEHLLPKSGWIMALLTLSQPFLFMYGFEVRTYSLLALLTALAILFYIKGNFLGLAISGAALLYSHLFGVWVVGILLIWSLLHRKNFWPLLLSVASFFPWVPNYLAFSRLGPGWQTVPDFNTLIETFLTLALPTLMLVLPALRLVREKKEALLLALLWLAPLLGTFLVSQSKPVFLDRYLIVVVPAEIILAGLAAAAAKLRPLLVIVLALQIAGSFYIFTHPTKAPFRELAQSLQETRLPTDVVVNASSLTYFESRYYGLTATIYSPDKNVPYYVGKVLIPNQDIRDTIPNQRFWLIELDEPGGKLHSPLPAKLLSERLFGRLKLSLYEPF